MHGSSTHALRILHRLDELLAISTRSKYHSKLWLQKSQLQTTVLSLSTNDPSRYPNQTALWIPHLVGVGNREALDGVVEVDVVRLNLAAGRNVNRLIGSSALLQTLPSQSRDENLATAINLFGRETAGKVIEAIHAADLLELSSHVVLRHGGAADSDSLGDGRVDGGSGCVRDELDEVRLDWAGHDRLEFFHCLCTLRRREKAVAGLL